MDWQVENLPTRGVPEDAKQLLCKDGKKHCRIEESLSLIHI